MLSGIARVARAGAGPAALVATVGLLDLAAAHLPTTVLVTGLLDEPAHLATAALILLAVGPWRRPRDGAALLPATALASAVIIDVDHIPLYSGMPGIAAGGRPFSHSLVIPTVALILSSALRGRARTVAFGVAIGTMLHFTRDLATGPGLPLGWPATTADVRIPEPLYAAALGAAAALAWWRSFAQPASTARRPQPKEPRIAPTGHGRSEAPGPSRGRRTRAPDDAVER